MGQIRVKVCGVTAPEHALAALEEGAAFIGLMFYPKSHRYVTIEQARRIADAVRAATAGLPGDQRPRLAGVFVNERVEHIRSTVEAVGLDLAQLSGDEPWDMLAKLGMPAIK